MVMEAAEDPEERVERVESAPELISQVQIARAFPRSLGQFTKKLTEMATFDQETSESCFYTLKRKAKVGGEKKIQGPSIRLAEMAIQCYGNLRWGGRTVREEERQVVCQGVLHDLQSNVAVTVEVSRRITTSDGRRYGDDMISVTSMAGVAICMRNAAFKGISSHLWKPAYDAALQKAVGDSSTLNDRRNKMIGAFAKMGVGVEKLLAFTERATLEEITLEDLGDLIGAFNGIREGEQTIDETFGKPEPKMPQSNAEAAAQKQAGNGSPAGQETTPSVPPVSGQAGAETPPAGDVSHGSPAEGRSAIPPQSEASIQGAPPAGDIDIDPANVDAVEAGLREEARAREQAEAKQEAPVQAPPPPAPAAKRAATTPPTNGKSKRQAAWALLVDVARKQQTSAPKLLQDMAKRGSLSECNDAEIEALVVALRKL